MIRLKTFQIGPIFYRLLSRSGMAALATYTHEIARHYDINVALHTDHCHPQYVDSFMLPLIEETRKRRARGEANLFSSHMFDGSALPMDENLAQSKKLMELCVENG